MFDIGRKTRWGIKANKLVSWIGVGICLKEHIATANYQFKYDNIGHGSYLISCNGYSWSHSVKEFNYACKAFNFTNNDIIYIEYDPKEGKLRFQKNNGPERYDMNS